MNDLELPTISPTDAKADLETSLRVAIDGEVRFDKLTRAIYATDASIYEIVPLGVVMPRHALDVAATIRECRNAGVSIVARGAGTGLAGGAVGPGVQLDLSRYMNRIGPVDVASRTVDVEPGVVLDELNHALAANGLHFAPDVATGSRATIGGMIANNSCGAYSVHYGRTVDHIAELTVVLADSEPVVFKRPAESSTAKTLGKRDDEIAAKLGTIRDHYFDEIQRRFPRVMRSNGGYGLDRLGPPGTPVDVTRILCGSEGTLGVIVSAKLKLEPLPRCRTLLVLHFHELLRALEVVPAMLEHKPAAIELIDRLIIDAGRRNTGIARQCRFLNGDPEALLAVEFFGESPEQSSAAANAMMGDPRAVAHAYSVVQLTNAADRAEVWNLRKSGLGLMMSAPGDAQPYSFVEDTAVDPSRLPEYIARFAQIIEREQVTAGYYAHASVGCLHVKPVLNLKNGADVERMHRIAEAVCDLAVEFGGTMTGEHGDGIVRSCWLERLYGPTIMNAFREVKDLFDPQRVFNPHKIVDPLPMTRHLRYGATFASTQPRTQLDFSAHGGIAGLAGMCSGVGECRKRLVGVMCPSYLATGDETHTTRARANALRVALSNRGLLNGLDDPALADVMDLCVSCKACKTECPTGVDMAKLKSEWLSHWNLTHGVPARSRLIADLPRWAARASRFPRLSNWIAQSKAARAWLERRFGIDRRVPPPRFAAQTFRAWFRAHRRRRAPERTPRGRVIYFIDTWTNYFAPQIGHAAIHLLEAAGFDVLCPPTVCCGRPAISKGLLHEARNDAESNLRSLAPAVVAGIPIVGTEPSCILTLVDEYPQLLRSPLSRRLAAQSMMLESFLHQLIERDPTALRFRQSTDPVLYHAHCHQKALVGSASAVALLQRVFPYAAEIPSGCCGMAGSFGHEVEHYAVAQAIGEDRLFPAVRARGQARVTVSGFSCRQQIAHHTALEPPHLCELIAAQLDTPNSE